MKALTDEEEDLTLPTYNEVPVDRGNCAGMGNQFTILYVTTQTPTPTTETMTTTITLAMSYQMMIPQYTDQNLP